MPFDGNGVYTPPAPQNPAIPNTIIDSSDYNDTINDIATAFDNCLTRDNQGKAATNMDWNGYRLTNVGNYSASMDAINFQSMNSYGAATYLRLSAGGAVTGTTSFVIVTAVTQPTSNDSTLVATTEYVQNVAFNTALPDQAGNAGKFVTTDGTSASWAEVVTDPINSPTFWMMR